MKKVLSALVVGALLASAQSARATPSTTFWTPETLYTQPYLIPHITYDTYVAEKGILQNTYGLTMGVLPFEKLQGEVGFDLFYPTGSLFTKDVFQLNGRLTLPENALGEGVPGLSVGIMNVGFKKDVSDYDLLHATLGKTTPIGLFGVGGYYGAGSKTLWTGSNGVERTGFMASWASPDITVNLPGLQKVVFAADVATGKNWLGGYGGGIGLYFTPSVSVLTGPVFFLDKTYYKSVAGTDWLWTVQLDIDAELFKKP